MNFLTSYYLYLGKKLEFKIQNGDNAFQGHLKFKRPIETQKQIQELGERKSVQGSKA